MQIEDNTSQLPLVSIICRSIGRPELKQALLSIEAQTYPNIEIVLVQASEKSLADYLVHVKKRLVNLVSTGTTLSRSDAANAGLDSTKGDYLMFLDDDDWLAADHVENLMWSLSNNSEVLAAYSSVQKVSADGLVMKDVFNHDFDSLLLMRENYIPIHSVLFSRTLLSQDCRFDPHFDIFEDWDFWLQLSQHTAFLHVDKLTAFYREGGESETASKDADAQDRYIGESLIAKGRGKLFTKWLGRWDGETFNQLLASLDKSNAIHKLNEAIAAQQRTIQWQQENIDDRDSRIVTLAAELAESRQVTATLKEQLESALTQLHEANLRAESIQKTNVELQHQLHSQLEQIEHQRAKLEHQQQQIQAMALHIDEIEQALQRVYNSSSWKITGPMRRIMRVARSFFTKKEIAGASEEPASDSIQSTERIGADKPKVHFVVDRSVYTDGVFYIRGWACSYPAIERIDVVCEGVATAVTYGGVRDDIGQAFPLIESARFSGFSYFAVTDQAESYLLRFYDRDGLRCESPIQLATEPSLAELSALGELQGLDAIDQYSLYRRLQKAIDNNQTPLKPLPYEPLISIIVPVYNVDKKWLDACIQSVLVQSYTHWELCLHDDASTRQETLQCLSYWAEQDSRIKVQFGTENQHISGASNSALNLATGEFIGLMDNDDELAIDALYWVVDAINRNPKADYLYSDEDKIDEEGNYCQPHFKPDWSPEMLESMMYVGHFGVIRRSIIDRIGGFRIGYEGSQDFDLTLRSSRLTQHFVHIPKVLYHWRIIPGSVAGGSDQKDYAYTSSFKALSEHVNAGDTNGSVATTATPGLYRVYREFGTPRVGIIMPFHNKAEMTIECLQSILKSSYTNYEVLVISNNSNEEEYAKVANFVRSLRIAKIVKHDIPFNWSALNNWGAAQLSADYFLFLNNDMKIISEDWLEAMLSCAVVEGVGAVGAKLLYEDDTVQHAGIVMNLGGVAGHPFKGLPADHPGYFGYAEIVRNVSAVTGACLLVKNSVFAQANGFDESLGVAYNDVDFCLRLGELGLRIVFTPFARLYHFESKTRPKTPADMTEAQREQFEKESAYIMQRYSAVFEEGDPYYNKALTLTFEDYSLKL